ncbi:MAG: DUF1499 domain-containing protein [Desulfobacterales bacterium]|nr:DUF1499 domain-containing protein [Desulfobacterales bacterium]
MITIKPMYFLISGLMVFAMLILSCAPSGKRPVGMAGGKLAPCPESPNCVSSEGSSGSNQIEPLTFTGRSETAWIRLERIVLGMGGTIERKENDYMGITFKTTLFRFVDDMELRMDAANQLIHIRSASRVGYWDFGANRRRVEALRHKFRKEQDQSAGISLDDV